MEDNNFYLCCASVRDAMKLRRDEIMDKAANGCEVAMAIVDGHNYICATRNLSSWAELLQVWLEYEKLYGVMK